MAISKSTTFILVPGAFHQPTYLEGLKDGLLHLGYDSIVVQLSTFGQGQTSDSFPLDVDSIYKAIKGVADQGREAVVVAHSYGGVPATEAVGKLVQNFQQAGKSYGRLRLVFVAAYVLLQEQALGSAYVEPYKGRNPPPSLMGTDYTETHCIMNQEARTAFYQDLPIETAEKLRDTIEPHALTAFTSPITKIGWEMVPSSYVFALDDGAISIALQRFMVERAVEDSKNNSSEGSGSFSGDLGTLSLECGHFGPYYTKVTELASFLDKVAESR